MKGTLWASIDEAHRIKSHRGGVVYTEQTEKETSESMETIREYIMNSDFESLCEVCLVDKRHAAIKLASPRRNNYLSAYKLGEHYALKKINVVCPSCGLRLHQYAAKTDEASVRQLENRQMDRQIKTFLDDQITFFDDENRDYIEINTPLPFGTMVECPRCGTHGILCEQSSERKVYIATEADKLSVSCELSDIFDALSIGWVSYVNRDVAIGLPPYEEKIIFDFGNGTTTVQLIDRSGVVCGREITSEMELVGHDRIAEVFSNFMLRRRIKSAFAEIYDYRISFTADELNLDRYILHTKYMGYYRDFYDCIPFIMDYRPLTRGERRLPESISGISKLMHRMDDIPALYGRIGLPAVKSVRRIVYEEPALMFYANELKLLNKVFPDVNYFRRIITCDAAYRILASLVCFGKAVEYLVMLREVLGMRRLYEYMKNRDSSVIFSNGMIYSAMNDEDKALVRSSLMNSPDPFRDITMLPKGFSLNVPMNHMRKQCYDWDYDGYRFKTLKTSDDYERAGMDLHNCLNACYGCDRSYADEEIYENDMILSHNENTIVGVLKNGKYVGAVDIYCDGTVGFSAIEYNKPVTLNPRFFNAYVAWLKRFGLLDMYL